MPKCNYCKCDIEKKDVIKYLDKFVKTPKNVNMCSKTCVENYERDQTFKKTEQEGYLTLCEYIMKIHGHSFLPNVFYTILKDLRDGTIRQKDILLKKDKQGVTWQDLFISYKFSEESIKKSILIKSFSTLTHELQYGLAIVKNNLPRAKQLQKQKEMNEKVESKIVVVDECEYVKKTFKDDISDLLN